MKKLFSALLVIIALASAVAAFVHHQRKHEDDVAYFSLNEIHKSIDACRRDDVASYQQELKYCDDTFHKKNDAYRKTGEGSTADMLTQNLDCVSEAEVRSMSYGDSCDAVESALMEYWAVKYPRQAANLKRDALASARRRDERAARAK